MDGSHNPGNGISDVLMTVPSSIFAGVGADQFVILYSEFSGSQGSFEEWSALEVPELSTAALLALSFLGLAVSRERLAGN
jgi:hypothetical protein